MTQLRGFHMKPRKTRIGLRGLSFDQGATPHDIGSTLLMF
jgi:hypothetical protein